MADGRVSYYEVLTMHYLVSSFPLLAACLSLSLQKKHLYYLLQAHHATTVKVSRDLSPLLLMMMN